jgi:hypothetical protein
MREIRSSLKILIAKHEVKRPLGSIGIDREDNIRIDVGDIGWEVVDWIYVAHYRDQCRTSEHGNEPSGSIKGG